MSRTKKILILILLMGAALRVGAAIALGDKVEALPGIHDQISYHSLAVRVINGQGFTFGQAWWPATRAGEPTAHWSYVYTFYLAFIYKIFGAHPLAARLPQALISGLIMPLLVFRLTRRAFLSVIDDETLSLNAENTALIASAWTAVYPYFLYYASALMTETFFILGVLWILDIAFRITPIKGRDNYQRNVGIWVLLGLAIGVSALLRQLVLLWIPFLFAWLFWARNRIARQFSIGSTVIGCLISTAVVIVMIIPFTLYNAQRFGRLVLLNTNAGYAFFWANHPIYGDRFIPILTPDLPSYQELIPPELLDLDEAALDQALLVKGIGFVADDPQRYLRLSVSRIPVYFQFWPTKESSLPSNLTRLFSIGLALPFMLIGTAAWYMSVRSQRIDPAPGSLLLLFTLIFSGIHLLSWALIRYRLPADAVMLVFAANGLVLILQKLGLWPWILTKISPNENPLSGTLRTDPHPDQTL